MTSLVVISDASPLLTFLAAGCEHLLLAAVRAADARLTAPEEVVDEVRRKALRDRRFVSAGPRLDRLIAARDLVELQSDLVGNPALSAAVQQVTHRPDPRIALPSKDLGETMAMAHAIVQARMRRPVKLLIEEHRAQSRAAELRLSVFDTQSVLRRCALLGLVEDRGAMRQIWDRLRWYDDSLVNWDQVRQLQNRELYR